MYVSTNWGANNKPDVWDHLDKDWLYCRGCVRMTVPLWRPVIRFLTIAAIEEYWDKKRELWMGNLSHLIAGFLEDQMGTQYKCQKWSESSVIQCDFNFFNHSLPGVLFRQVTIFGESAGAQSVSLHLMIQSSKPLFKQAVLQSLPFSIPLKTRWGIMNIGVCSPNVHQMLPRPEHE